MSSITCIKEASQTLDYARPRPLTQKVKGIPLWIRLTTLWHVIKCHHVNPLSALLTYTHICSVWWYVVTFHDKICCSSWYIMTCPDKSWNDTIWFREVGVHTAQGAQNDSMSQTFFIFVIVLHSVHDKHNAYSFYWTHSFNSPRIYSLLFLESLPQCQSCFLDCTFLLWWSTD